MYIIHLGSKSKECPRSHVNCHPSGRQGWQTCDLRHSLFAPMVSIRFFCLARPKIQHSRSGAGSVSGTFGPLGKKTMNILNNIWVAKTAVCEDTGLYWIIPFHLFRVFLRLLKEFLFRLTRRGSGIRVTDSAKTLGYVFEYSYMKKAAILDPYSKNKKIKVLVIFSFILKKVSKKTFS